MLFSNRRIIILFSAVSCAALGAAFPDSTSSKSDLICRRSYTRRAYISPEDECEEECRYDRVLPTEICIKNCLERPYGPAHRGTMPDPPRLKFPLSPHSYSSPGPPQSPAFDQEDGPQDSASPPVQDAYQSHHWHPSPLFPEDVPQCYDSESSSLASSVHDEPQSHASPPVKSAEYFRPKCQERCTKKRNDFNRNNCVETCMARLAEEFGYPKYTPNIKLDPKKYKGVVKDPMKYKEVCNKHCDSRNDFYSDCFEKCIGRTARRQDKLYYEPNVNPFREKRAKPGMPKYPRGKESNRRRPI